MRLDDLVDRLEAELAAFRASGFDPQEYPGWAGLYAAAEELVGLGDGLSAPAVDALLGAVAADHESQLIAEKLAENQASLARVAPRAPDFPDPDARWQVASALGDPAFPPAIAEPVLARLWADPDEYVRRRALLALGGRRSAAAGRCAREAWASNQEYLRIASLHVLAQTGDPGLTPVLAEAWRDPRATVRAAGERAVHLGNP